MFYWPKHNIVFHPILKNGSTALTELFKFVLGEGEEIEFNLATKDTDPNTSKLYITTLRNPYDRLVSQFYNVYKSHLTKPKYRLKSVEHLRDIHTHFFYFRYWVKETYENGYNGEDPHLYSQWHTLDNGYQYGADYKIFKMENLIPHELFFFLKLDDNQKKEIDDEYLKIMDHFEKNNHHATNNQKKHTWEVYHDSNTIRICNEYFADDFKKFEYQMINPSEFRNRNTFI